MNKALFDDLYFGDYRPNDITIESEEYDNIISEVTKLHHNLSAKLSKEDYAEVRKLDDFHNQLNDLYAKQSYTDGIKFAVNFLYNALCDNLSGKK